MLLHPGDILPGLIKGFHLEFVHNNPTSMQLVDHHIQLRRVKVFCILDHDELTQLLIKTHT